MSKEKLERGRFLEPFFTNLDDNVYAITNALPSELAAALIARQSRAPIRDAREVVWQEFASASEFSDLDWEKATRSDLGELLGSEKARSMIRRIIDQFGDDSVREQASGYLMCQDISVFAATFGFTHPLLTRVEASTRYIDWGQKVDGKYLYKSLDFGSDEASRVLYEEMMDELFETYQALWQPVWDFVVAKNPKSDDASEAAYLSSVRGRVCDNLRGLLPLASLTNFGLHGNYRALSEQLIGLMASENDELFDLGKRGERELSKINPEFVAVVNSAHGEAWKTYKRKVVKLLAEKVLERSERNDTKEAKVRINLIDKNYEMRLAEAFIASTGASMSRKERNQAAWQMLVSGDFGELLKKIGEARGNRRHHPPEFLREVVMGVRFEGISFGSLKDLFRHRRILWRTAPDWSATSGYHLPVDITEMGGEVLANYKQAQERACGVVQQLRKVNPEAAKYALTHGTKTTFEISCDLAEALWISDLRSMASGFEEYRWFAQNLWRQMLLWMPAIETLGNFVDMTPSYSLGRIKEAIRTDVKGRG